ncbi:MAG TPA: tetratricopeptide repeat protein, partial [Isosphaeraceae bacterium]|nr:tetratricopeptide repeat protein [Isosphaeraceae bacterium]
AIEDFDRAIQLVPRRVSAYIGRGGARFYRNDYSGALADLDRAVTLGPKSEEAFFARAVIRQGKGDLDGAIADHTEAIRLDPTAFRSFSNRGRLWMEKHDVPKAITDFDEFIRLAPDSPIGYINRGQCRSSAKDYSGAIVDFDAAIRLDPKLALAYINRGIAWRAKGEYDRAILDFSAALRLDPSPSLDVAGVRVEVEYVVTDSLRVASGKWPIKRVGPGALVERGNCRATTGRFAEALADFDEALRLDPEYLGPLVERAWLWAGCPDPRFRDGPGAIESASRAFEATGGKKPYVLGALAAAQAETGDFVAAIANEEKAMRLYEDESNRTAGRRRLASYRARRPYRMSVYPGHPVPLAARETPPPPPTESAGPFRPLVNRLLRK